MDCSSTHENHLPTVSYRRDGSAKLRRDDSTYATDVAPNLSLSNGPPHVLQLRIVPDHVVQTVPLHTERSAVVPFGACRTKCGLHREAVNDLLFTSSIFILQCWLLDQRTNERKTERTHKCDGTMWSLFERAYAQGFRTILGLIEKEYVPDFVVRCGIRYLLRQRLAMEVSGFAM